MPKSELERLLEAASPGPWTWNQGRWVHAPMRTKEGIEHTILVAPAINDGADEDARLAALAPAMARASSRSRSAATRGAAEAR